MKYFALALSLVLIPAASLRAQQTSDIHQQTTTPSNARFEIVQSELAAKWTFRLDRFTGHVSQLTRTKGGDNAWDEMQVIGIPHVPSPVRARFQIFTSGIAARHTFLIDTDTGNTWVLTTTTRKSDDGSEYEVNLWEPFAE